MKFAVVFVLLAFACAVSAAGPEAQSPSCYALDQPSDLPGQKQPDIDCKKCRVEAVIQQTLTGKAAYIPQCNVGTNKFLPKQCDASTGFCWCSSLYGIEIPNTKTKKKGLVCKKKAKKGHNCSRQAATKGFTPKCNGKDFHKVQCMASGFCWCSMKDGFLVPNTIHNKNLKKSPPNCAAHTDLKFKCGKRLGNVQHPFDLTRYLKCGAGGKTYACSCPAKTIFNPKKQVCQGFPHLHAYALLANSGNIGWTAAPDGYQYFYFENKKTWYDAEHICVLFGGHLAMEKTLKTQVWMTMKYRNKRFWVGVYCPYSCEINHKDKFMYADKTKLKTPYWDKNQPDNDHGNENCVEQWKNKGLWNDLDCQKKLPFLCQKKQKP